jgi:hypothetical protein
VPFLAVVHLRQLVCPECSAEIAPAGARSFVVDRGGSPINFDQERMPSEMTLSIACPNGHVATLLVPNEVAAEETLLTPEGAPIAPDAVFERNLI